MWDRAPRPVDANAVRAFETGTSALDLDCFLDLTSNSLVIKIWSKSLGSKLLIPKI